MNNVPFLFTKLFQEGDTIQWGHYLRKYTTRMFNFGHLQPKTTLIYVYFFSIFIEEKRAT